MNANLTEIVNQHQNIVKHFLKLQRELEDLSEMVALLGYAIEDITQRLQEKDKNNSLQEIEDVN